MDRFRQPDTLTAAQQSALAAHGNVLVMAGAGTGKTRTLVGRCLHLLCARAVSLDEILIVTFTEAAAAEMRRRLRAALEDQARQQLEPYWLEQLALFDTAHIGTLHSFCFRLAREHFYELGLDPQSAILSEGQARLLADETLDELMQSHYAGHDEFSRAVQQLVQVYGGGRDQTIRSLVLRLHDYSQTRPDAAGWRARQIAMFSAAEPLAWRESLLKAVGDWRREWQPLLENWRAENPKAAELLELLRSVSWNASASDTAGNARPRNASPPPLSRQTAAALLAQVLAADTVWPHGTKKKFRAPLKDFFDDAKFLHSLAAPQNGADPLAEDWNWVRSHMIVLLQLAGEFSETFSARKRAEGVLDFHDLEQCALRLLWNPETDTPTDIARRWREQLRYIFVDEYQDINAAQDKIILALSREGFDAGSSSEATAPPGNRFLVGDVKQSIYRFRLAEPGIFRDYARRWRGKHGRTIPLSENFRSHESLLRLVNSVFSFLMREEVGGVNYDDEAKLKPGVPENRPAPSAEAPPRAELLLYLKKEGADFSGGENDQGDELDETEKEARLLALRLRELKNAALEIRDVERGVSRVVEWRDMAVLLRSPAGKAEIFARQFERAGVPLTVARGGWFDSREVLDCLSLLQVLDNPLQDVPCIAVLRSPLVGCSLDELARIRLAARGHFWFALNRFPATPAAAGSRLAAKIEQFLERFRRWRRLTQHASLSQCLEAILAETHYADWLRAQPRGAQRAACLEQFLHLVRQFDRFQRQSLFRFLKFVEAQREAAVEPETPGVAEENAVRLMSIHQSKGLEFPVVALANLAKPFNLQELRGDIILDEEYGLCPRVRPPERGGRYPSLAHWLARRRQKRELLGEELRLLYVAMTRARERLILSASVSEKKWETLWNQPGPVTLHQILSARSSADWLGLWFASRKAECRCQSEDRDGALPELRWRKLDDAALAENGGIRTATAESPPPLPGDAAVETLRRRLEWNYPFAAATKRQAKASVTALRREATEGDDEAKPLFPENRFAKFPPADAKSPTAKLSASQIGAAHHKFLQHFDIQGAADVPALAAEAQRLETENILSADERAALNLQALAAFWNSDLGRKIRAQRDDVRREWPFTAKFSPAELDEILGTRSAPTGEDEFIVVQGVADLVVLRPEETWLVDFKTDEVPAGGLAEKIKTYAPQLKLYAAALEKVYSRPVVNRWLHFLAVGWTEKI